MKADRAQKDIKRNCTFHKDIEHNTDTCMALKDEIEMLIREDQFKEFMDEPQAANREERPRQRGPEKVQEVLTIIGGSHQAGESRSACDKYLKTLRLFP